MTESQAGGDNTLQTFLLFPELPTEVRLHIWHLILGTPRTISLKYTEEPEEVEVSATSPDEFVRKLGYFYIEKDDGPVSLMDVNIEAREETLKVYKDNIDKVIRVGFSQWTKYTKEVVVQIPREEKTIPISFPNTTFFLSTRELPRVPSSLITRFQHLRFSVLDPGYFPYFTLDYLKAMTSLRTVTLAGKKGVDYGWSGMENWWQQIMKEFEDEKLKDLEWECPHMNFLDLETGNKLGEMEAGKGDPEVLAVRLANVMSLAEAAELNF